MSALLPVAEALARVLDGVEALGSEIVPLAEAQARVLAAPVAARRTQPPSDFSAMDGYAVRASDVAVLPAALSVIGTAPAGHPFAGQVAAGQAVRIFTGAIVPEGADSILLQEDARVSGEASIEATEAVRPGQHVRRRGLDFVAGDVLLQPGMRMGMRQLTLAAALDHATVPVRRRPRVAIIASGDELVLPGGDLSDGQIVASNSFGIAALVRSLGGVAIDLGIVADDRNAFAAAVDRAIRDGVDVLVTLGGASVGDHDFAQEVLIGRGMDLGFWKIAMRPGKPLIFGRLGPVRVLGLPGNPVSSLVCSVLFLQPLIEALLGLPPVDRTERAQLGAAMGENDRRQDYVRARLERVDDRLVATPFPHQDSSMLSIFAASDCLIIRPPHAPAAPEGEICRILRLP